MSSITDPILAGPTPQRSHDLKSKPAQAAPTWRKASAADIHTAATVRWKDDNGSWRYPKGIRADNLLHFDTERCEVLSA